MCDARSRLLLCYVDDLEDISDLEGYVDRSDFILIYLSQGYIESKNCMRELRSAVSKRKPIVALQDIDLTRGGITWGDVCERLLASDAKYNGWGFEGDGGPKGEQLISALEATPLIEWNRIGDFQDVTMRLIAERLLQAGSLTPLAGPSRAVGSRAAMPGTVYVQGEKTIVRPTVGEPAPGKTLHLYCSPHNAGALELSQELVRTHPAPLRVTSDVGEMSACEHMALYLTGRTWTSANTTMALAHEVALAMQRGVHILLLHEMPGEEQAARHGVEFGTFFADPDGATPGHLLKAGIYAQIAVPLKGVEYRKVSMALFATMLADGIPDDVAPVTVDEPPEFAAFGQSAHDDDIETLACD